jgi:hypothetical protein
MVQEDKCNYVYATIMETGQINTELTCRFSTTSLSGNKLLIPQARPAHAYSISPWEMNHLPRGIEQQAYNLIRITQMGVTSHSQPLINSQHLMASNKLLVNNTK